MSTIVEIENEMDKKPAAIRACDVDKYTSNTSSKQNTTGELDWLNCDHHNNGGHSLASSNQQNGNISSRVVNNESNTSLEDTALMTVIEHNTSSALNTPDISDYFVY